MQQPIRVLIADDHQLFREGLRHILISDPLVTVVGMAATAIETLEHTIDKRPDIVLLDVDMPGGGISVLKEGRL